MTVTGSVVAGSAQAPAGTVVAALPVEASVTGLLSGTTLAARAGIVTGALPQVYGPVVYVSASAASGSVEAFQIDRSGNIMTLTLYDDDVTQPGALRASIGNGLPGATVHVFIDGVEVRLDKAELDSNGILFPLAIPVVGLPAGSHTVAVGTTHVAPASGTVFTTLNNGVLPSTDDQPEVPPLPTLVGRWIFQSYDLDHSGVVRTYLLPRNPDSVDKEFGDLAIKSEPMVFGGRVASWQGQPPPTTWKWTGHLLSQAEFEAMARWGQGTSRLYVLDHHGDRYLMKIASYETTRVRDPARPWHHTYTMTVRVLTGSIGAVLPDVHGKVLTLTFDQPPGVAAGGVGRPEVTMTAISYAGQVVGGVTGNVAGAVLSAQGQNAGLGTGLTGPQIVLQALSLAGTVEAT